MAETYALFAGRQYYPEGGTEDLLLAFSAPDDATAIERALATLADVLEPDWYYLAALNGDAGTVRIVWDPLEFCEASQAR